MSNAFNAAKNIYTAGKENYDYQQAINKHGETKVANETVNVVREQNPNLDSAEILRKAASLIEYQQGLTTGQTVFEQVHHQLNQKAKEEKAMETAVTA